MIRQTIHFDVFEMFKKIKQTREAQQAKPTHYIIDDIESKRNAKKEAEQHLIDEAIIDDEGI